MDSLGNDKIDSLMEKFKGFEGVVYQLNKLKEDNIKYFTIRVDGVVETERDLEDAIRFNLIKKFKKFLMNMNLIVYTIVLLRN